MAAGIVAVQRGGPSGRDHSSSEDRGGGAMQDLGWLPVALGAAAIVAGLGGRQKGTIVLALTALAGVTAVSARRGVQPDGTKADGRGQGGASDGVRQVERSITIGRSADELRRAWLDPETLPQIMAGFATVRASGDGRMHWTVNGPLGRAYEWDSETAADQPGDGIGWRSSPNAAIWERGIDPLQRGPGRPRYGGHPPLPLRPARRRARRRCRRASGAQASEPRRRRGAAAFQEPRRNRRDPDH